MSSEMVTFYVGPVKCIVPPCVKPRKEKTLRGFYFLKNYLRVMSTLRLLLEEFLKINHEFAHRLNLPLESLVFSNPSINLQLPTHVGHCLDSVDKSLEVKLIGVNEGQTGFILDVTFKHPQMLIYRYLYNESSPTKEEVLTAFKESLMKMWTEYYCDSSTTTPDLSQMLTTMGCLKMNLDNGFDRLINRHGIVDNEKLLRLKNDYDLFVKVRSFLLNQKAEYSLIELADILNAFNLRPNFLGWD